jgi:small multidrug resistance pump
MSWFWLTLAIMFEITATMSLRASDGFRRKPWLIGVVLGYSLSFSCLGLTLKAGMSVGIAYGIWTAVGVLLLAILANLIWKEPLTKRMLVGIAVIVTVVFLVELG